MHPSRARRIGVLVGGEPPERELSIRAGEAVLCALAEAGRDAVLVHADHHLDCALRQEHIDVAFLATASRDADGPVQGLLETLGIPYTGSSFAAAALAADRLKVKELLRLHNLPSTPYYRHSRGMGGALEQHHGFGFPCIVRPRSGGRAIGALVARDEEELQAAIDTALRLDDDVLVERRAHGMEVQVAILDGQVLGAAEIGAGNVVEIATRRPRAPRVIVPPRLAPERLRGALALAVRAHHLLGCSGLTRVELAISEQGNERLVDLDTAPDLGPGSLVPKLAHASALSFGELVARLLESARLHLGRRLHERRSAQLPLSQPDRRAGGAADPH